MSQRTSRGEKFADLSLPLTVTDWTSAKAETSMVFPLVVECEREQHKEERPNTRLKILGNLLLSEHHGTQSTSLLALFSGCVCVSCPMQTCSHKCTAEHLPYDKPRNFATGTTAQAQAAHARAW